MGVEFLLALLAAFDVIDAQAKTMPMIVQSRNRGGEAKRDELAFAYPSSVVHLEQTSFVLPLPSRSPDIADDLKGVLLEVAFQ